VGSNFNGAFLGILWADWLKPLATGMCVASRTNERVAQCSSDNIILSKFFIDSGGTCINCSKGGALYLSQADVKIYTSTFENNSAVQVINRVVGVAVSVKFPYFLGAPTSGAFSCCDSIYNIVICCDYIA
jgi:hypothetical protein